MANICYGRKEATHEMIEKSAKLANCQEFIQNKEFSEEHTDSLTSEEIQFDSRYDDLPDGYKTK